METMRYILTNPEEVVEFGLRKLAQKIEAGKLEVEDDIAAFIYYPSLAVVEKNASYADISAAFNYLGFPSREGILTLSPERLIKYFIVEKQYGENTWVKFNFAYVEDFDFLDRRIKNDDL